jgi:hypothetical protein
MYLRNIKAKRSNNKCKEEQLGALRNTNMHRKITMQREITTKEDVFEEQQQTKKEVPSRDHVLEKQH